MQPIPTNLIWIHSHSSGTQPYPHSQEHQAAIALKNTPDHLLGALTHRCRDELSSPHQNSINYHTQGGPLMKQTTIVLTSKQPREIMMTDKIDREQNNSYPCHYNCHLHVERLLHKKLIIARFVKEA